MRAYYLESAYKRFAKEADWLAAEFEAAIQIVRFQKVNRFARLTAEMAVVRLHDSWARFTRELIVLSAGAKPFTASGIRLSLAPGVKRIEDVIPQLLRSYRQPRNYEPTWAQPSKAIDAARRLAIQNLTTVTAAIGATNLPAEEIRPLRNFLVHRGKNSATMVKHHPTYSGLQRLCIEDTAGAYVPSGATRFEAWILNFKSVALAAIQ
jgi:hypothetical protein